MSARKRLFTPEQIAKNGTRCKDLVVIPRDECFRCGGPVQTMTRGQAALFVHGGYGATQVTTFAACLATECMALRVKSVAETNPRRGATGETEGER